MGGWVEELDADYNIVNVYGEKMTTEKSYTPDDILELASAYGSTEYIGFLCSRDTATADSSAYITGIL